MSVRVYIVVLKLLLIFLFSEHMAHLKATSGRKNKSEKVLLDEHNKTFINWLQDRVSILNPI